MKPIKTSIFVLLIISFSIKSKAQLGGVFSVPGDFLTIASAVNTLNIMGIATGVTINVSAGHTETVAPGGIKLFNVVGTSSSNRIVFQKSGIGANPLITAYTGTATLNSSIQDGIWWFIGADYVTVDGIDLFDPNTSGNAMMEFGYGFYKWNAGDGCQNNIVKNCVITMNRNNVTNSPSYVPGGSRGIDMISASYTLNTTAVAGTSTAGSNSYNSFYGNTIQNCHVGIALLGATSSLYSDAGNDVGGLSSATGNFILNYGGGIGNSYSSGVITSWQTFLNISFNTINNNNGTGLSPNQAISGINVGIANSESSINSNTITMSTTSTLNISMVALSNQCYATNTQTVSIKKNVFPSFSYTSAVGAFAQIIQHGGTSNLGYVAIDSNIVNNVSYGHGTFSFISASNSSSCSIKSNTITNHSAKSGSLSVFYTSSAGRVYLTDNYVGNMSFTGPGTNTVSGVYINSPGGYTGVLSNTFDNFVLGASTTTAACFARVIYVPSATSTRYINLNTIRNFSTYSLSASGFSFTGIELVGGSGAYIEENSIYNITSTTTNTAATTYFHGIWVNGSPTFAYVGHNKIGGFNFNSRGYMYLIRSQSASTGTTFYNNIIGDASCPNSDQAEGLIGIYIQSGGASITYNSVHLNSAVTPGLELGSSALSVPISGTVTLKNNIFINNSSTGPTGVSKVIRFSSGGMGVLGATSNNNIYYAGLPASNRVIAQLSTSSFSTMAAFQNTVSPIENYSFSENTPFASTVASSNNFLTINPLIPTLAESNAQPFSTTYLTDYIGNLRHPVSPDCGAWEGNYVQADFYPPAIINSGFVGAACSNSGRTFTVSVYDSSGVATGSLAPRLYYRKNFTLYTSVQGSLSAGTTTNGVWSFNLTYTASPSDIILYYLAIQDNSPRSNMTIFPANNYVMVDVNTINTPPNPAQSYVISASVLSGTYNVGAGQTYTSLTQAANAYNTSCLAGPVTFSLTDNNYSVNETFPITFQLNTDASATNSLLIKPASGVSVNVVSSSTAIAVIKFIDAQYISIDGINQVGSSMLLTNSNTSTSTVIWLASDTGPMQGNKNIILNELNLKGSANTNVNYYGILSSANSTTINTNDGAINNNQITISNTSILRVGTGIYAVGARTITSGEPNSWSIISNTIGPVSSGTNNIFGCGIYIMSGNNFSVIGNVIQNSSVTVSSIAGISIAGYVKSSSISQNTVTNINSNGTSGSGYPISGIYLGLDLVNCNVSENVIRGINNINSSGYWACGIYCNTQYGTGNKIYNNFISQIFSRSSSFNGLWTTGITIAGSTGNINIDNNSINLSGSVLGSSSSAVLISASILVNTNGNNVNVRNNIFANSQDFSNNNFDKNYSFYSLSSANTFSTFENNNFYAGLTATNNPVLAFSGTDLVSLAAIQSTLGGNLLSSTLAPVFTSSVDLHLQSVTANLHLDNAGISLPGISSDIDGQSRSITSPDVGADEFSTVNCAALNNGTISPSSFSICTGQTLSLSPVGLSTESGISYQWQISTNSSGSYTNINLATENSYSTQALSSGVFYYRLKSLCSANNFSTTTNVFSLSIVATPSVTAAVSVSSLCAGNNFTLSGTSTGGASFIWTGPGSYTSSLQNPVFSVASTTSSGNYTLIGVAGTCSSSASSVSVSVQATPVISVSGNTSVCSGITTTLVASGATTYSWNTGVTSSSLVLTPTTSSVYSVAGFFPTGCTSSKTVSVLSSSPPTINVAVASASVCSGSPTSFTASGANTYTWNTGFQGSVLSLTPTAAVNYTITGSSVGGCIASQSVALGVYSLPVILASSSTPSVCSGSSTSLSASGAISYTWLPGNIQTSSVIVSPAVTSVYTVQGVNTDNCHASTSITITAVPLPTITISNGTVCLGSSYTLQPTGAASYSFLNGSSVVSPTTNTSYSITGTNGVGCSSTNTAVAFITIEALPTITVNSGTLCAGTSFTLAPSGAQTYSYSSGSAIVNPLNNTSYSVTGQSASGCMSSNTAISNLTVVASPTISVNSGTICSGQTFTLTPLGAVSYTYSGGSSLVSPTASTTYSVVGTNSLGCTSINSAVSTITVYITPTITASSGSICNGSSFTINPSGASSYTISGGSFVVSPAQNTTYTVAGTSIEGCVSSNSLITVGVIPIPTIAVNSGSLCSGETFTMNATGAQTYTYEGGSQFVSPTSNTSYTIIGANAFGCVSANTATAMVSVLSLPTVTINGPTSVCINTSITLTVSGASSYTWNTGGLSNNLSVTPVASTIYSVIGADLNGCKNSATHSVTANSGPSISITGNTTICEGSTTSLFAAGSAISFTWSTGANGNLVSVSPSVSTVYTVIGSNLNACPSTATVLIFVNSLPIVMANASSTSICIGNQVTLYGSGANTYTWSGGISNNVGFFPSVTGIYNLSGTSLNNCINTATISVVVNPLPIITILASADTVCVEEEVTLTASGANIYLWSPQGGSTPVSVINPSVSTVYSVNGIDINGCSNTKSVEIVVEECGEVGIKNNSLELDVAIYPNPSKGEFSIQLPMGLENVNIQVYNYLSQLVFTSEASHFNFKIDLQSPTKGLYLLQINATGIESIVRKIIIE